MKFTFAKKLRQVIKMILPLWAFECVYQKHFSVLNLLSSASIWEAIFENIGQLSWIHMFAASAHCLDIGKHMLLIRKLLIQSVDGMQCTSKRLYIRERHFSTTKKLFFRNNPLFYHIPYTVRCTHNFPIRKMEI